ncbi:hypothetical protein [Lysinibacillus sphaericus]|uniref:hypothetical protein n=1 Tax=Lysinibacillus sphaericus TaxID=1421 RepID=UPI001A9F450E|nr:hypothetical protein [Lysinibacillus sphaericus]QTB28872.1 hypothetical protein J2D51_09835 [Lysinibacillus sphaericus]
MSNLKGAILATALFAAVVFPFLLMMSIDAFQQHAFLKMTEEVTELVKEEGGVSEHVTQVTKRLKTKDLTVTFSKPGLVKFGEEIVIEYNYEYQNVRGKKTLDGQDKVVIMKRSTGKNGSNSNETNPPTEIAKSYSAKTPESLQPNKEYTFTVPGLKNLIGVAADMGKVDVVRVDGEKVTVKVSGGKVVKTVQTGGTNTLADEKYVTGEDSADYNNNGYTGTLERYLYSGKILPADSKSITSTKTSILSGNFPGSIAYASDGYSGILLKSGDPIKTVFSGEYTPSDTKWIEAATAEDYNQNGYTGKLEKYVVSGQYIPADSRYVEGQDQAYYNQNDYTGMLEQYVAGWKEVLVDRYADYVVPTSLSCPEVYPGGSYPLYDYTEDVMGAKTCYYKYTVSENIIINKYRGTVTKPGIDTRVYAYRGTVTKPATDTRIYEYVQNYSGSVTRPEMDTRIYKYRGTVVRPASDSRTYEDYYQYELNFRYM